MKNFSNTYIFIFSIIMVVIVAAVLSFSAMKLKPYQDKNKEIEKKRNILSSINIESDTKNAESLYSKYIISEQVLDVQGNIIENPKTPPFDIDLKKELDKDPSVRNLPLFISQMEDSSIYYIVPVRGKGLWGPIWGFVALQDDMSTLAGVIFDHSDETPGLGAEISTKKFQVPFRGKKIFSGAGKFQSIKVVKGGANPAANNEVDAISGGTITSKGLETMLGECLSNYIPFFEMKMQTR
ncbi:MAG: NADH:ubiquinone reductase (Na(+)-transporting) subunit C [Bacteroidales bacterium]|nr:NADH:ubiquinone reductase (Na(+)-transporting) subunit C [Bacteroidales bacterium]